MLRGSEVGTWRVLHPLGSAGQHQPRPNGMNLTGERAEQNKGELNPFQGLQHPRSPGREGCICSVMLWEMGKGFACDCLLFAFLLLSRAEFSPF